MRCRVFQQPTLSDMTMYEMNFSLLVEDMLGNIDQPKYRQIVVEVRIQAVASRRPPVTRTERPPRGQRCHAPRGPLRWSRGGRPPRPRAGRLGRSRILGPSGGGGGVGGDCPLLQPHARLLIVRQHRLSSRGAHGDMRRDRPSGRDGDVSTVSPPQSPQLAFDVRVFQLLMVVSIVLERNPELEFQDKVDLDKLVKEAFHEFQKDESRLKEVEKQVSRENSFS